MSAGGTWQLTLEQNRHRAIVDQGDLHVGAENAGGDVSPALPQHIDVVLVQRPRQTRFCRVTEARPIASRSVCRQGELRDDQNAAVDVHDRAVHRLQRVGKNAKRQSLRRQPFRLRFGVVAEHPEEDQQTVVDLRHGIAIDGDRCAGNALA